MEPPSSQSGYKRETDIVPPSFHPETGRLIEPAHAGPSRITVLDSDDEAGGNRPIVRHSTIKREVSPEIKSEGEEQPSVLSLGRGRDSQPGPHRCHGAPPQRTSRPRTPSRRNASRSASNTLDDSSDDSSDDGGLTPSSTSSSDSSSGDSDMDWDDDEFRPSKSPSRLPDQPSPTTRSQSRGRRVEEERAKSVANPRPIEVVIRSIPRNASGGGPSRLYAGEAVQDSSPAGSVRHGWRVVNRKNRAKTPAGSSREHQSSQDAAHKASSLGPGRETSPATAQTSLDFHSARATTAGPSFTACDHRSARTRHQSPKGKERAVEPDYVVIDGDSDDDKHRKKTSKKDKKKKKKNKDKKKKSKKEKRREEKGKGRAVEPEPQEDRPRRPPRLARMERSIEQTPSPGLPTPEPSSSRDDFSRYCNHSPGLFVSSPPRTATPGPSRPSCSSPVRAGVKRRHVEFMDLDSPEPDPRYMLDSMESCLGAHEARLGEHERKHMRLQEDLTARVVQFTEEVDRQNLRLAEAEASRIAVMEALESLKQQFNEANARFRQQLDARPASAAVSQSQQLAIVRPADRFLRPAEVPHLELNRRNGINGPRPGIIPDTLVRSGSGANRQRLAMQNRVRQAPALPHPPNNGQPSGSSSRPVQHNGIERRRDSPEAALNASM